MNKLTALQVQIRVDQVRELLEKIIEDVNSACDVTDVVSASGDYVTPLHKLLGVAQIAIDDIDDHTIASVIPDDGESYPLGDGAVELVDRMLISGVMKS